MAAILNPLGRLLAERKLRFAKGKFKALTAAPFVFTVGFQMPAAGKLFVKLGALTAANTVVITAKGRNISVPPLAANKLYPLGYFERGVTIAPVYAASTMQLFREDQMGKRILIASKP